jgi:hypothetical protein
MIGEGNVTGDPPDRKAVCGVTCASDATATPG